VPLTSLHRLAPVLTGALSIVACSALGAFAQAHSDATPAMYATKAEAEAAAKKHFNCTGAHQMGNQWMPCASHGQSNGNAQHNH
jgi:hypothetical protein